MKKLRQCLGTVGLVLACMGCMGGAQAIPLSTLLDGGSITAGDKLFSEWSFAYASSDANRVFNPTNIEVTALNDGGDNPGPGLQFNILSGELTVTGDGIYAYADLTLAFHVDVLDPLRRIKDNSLQLIAGSLTTTRDADNGSYIQEFVGTTPGGTDLVNFKDVELSWDGSNLINKPIDTAAFAPQNAVWVTKNILVWATGAEETAALESFSQRFSQEVPEPGTLALVGIAGLIALVLRPRISRRL